MSDELTFTHYWRVRKTLPERFGERCVVVGRSAGPGPRSIAVRFADGGIVITHRYAVRRVESKSEGGGGNGEG
jgi:hypothetical protein